ncbi:Tyrosine-protein phosphatase YwqE [Clostridiales bacterium CHKCI001]|nr:Tyrosine-protein phosphatase YwqE [Clostridiales bacterium CHKCI001]
MYDIHCHILPGIDDGAQDMEEALQMAEMAVEAGTKVIVATPHCNVPHFYRNYKGEWYYKLMEKFRKALAENDIKITILPGMEVFSTEELPSLICEDKIIMLNNGCSLLMEFGFDDEPDYISYIIQKIIDLKVKPVIAHVERYECIQNNPDIIAEWKKMGCAIQVNKDSFLGLHGIYAEEVAYTLLENEFISVLASDAHGVRYRTPNMMEIEQVLYAQYGEKKIHSLLYENARILCRSRQ